MKPIRKCSDIYRKAWEPLENVAKCVGRLENVAKCNGKHRIPFYNTAKRIGKHGNPSENTVQCQPPLAEAPRLGRSRRRTKTRFIGPNLCCGQASCKNTGTGELCVLVAKEPIGAICTVADDEWVEIDVAIDSGSADTVMAEATLNGIVDITEGPALRRGVTYEVANGVDVSNLWERKFVGVAEEAAKDASRPKYVP